CQPLPELRQGKQRFHVGVAFEEEQVGVAPGGTFLDGGQGQVAVVVTELPLLGRQLVRRLVALDGGHADPVGGAGVFSEGGGGGGVVEGGRGGRRAAELPRPARPPGGARRSGPGSA